MTEKEWNIGDKIECIHDDNVVLPIRVGSVHTITNIHLDTDFNILCIRVDNSEYYYDEYEFAGLFKKIK